MSNEQTENQTQEAPAATTEAAKSAVNNAISAALALKEQNPKVFYGGVGGLVVLLLIVIFSGGGSEKVVSGPTMKNLVVGQQYVLKSANAYDENATIRLVSVPGNMAAYDDTEEADRTSACQHMPQNTPVTVLELQDAYGKKAAFAKVQIESGECKGNSAWALSIDVQ